MATIRTNDRCEDCKYCRIWESDPYKALCLLEQGFDLKRFVPAKCVGQRPKR